MEYKIVALKYVFIRKALFEITSSFSRLNFYAYWLGGMYTKLIQILVLYCESLVGGKFDFINR